MKFCPKCGAMLVMKTKNFGCPRCKYSTSEKVSLKTREKMDEKHVVAVIKDKDVDTLPSIATECPKCNHDEAHFWTSQTRGSDETETRFFRCKKCRHTWREYR